MFNGKGLKLYVYRKEDYSDEPAIVDFEGMEADKFLQKPSWGWIQFNKFIQNEKGEYGIQLEFRFGYHGGEEVKDLFPGDKYKYVYVDLDITGPTDWDTDYLYAYLVLVKE